MSPDPNHVLDRHLTVRVLSNARGEWEVLSAHSLCPHRYNTLDEATRAAYAVAYRDGPCELVVHDAYHRVVHTQHVEPGRPGATPGERNREWSSLALGGRAPRASLRPPPSGRAC